jgi:hypothetical protein
VIDERGNGLIFLLSQPRAGSTLLQRMLAAHSAIHTTQEPAIALYPLYGLAGRGVETEYGAEVGQVFTRAFLATLPEGEEAYVVALRKMLGHLYNRALAGSGKPRFLDKTPRYYFIIPELLRVFPEARYVILYRNPLAVMASVLTTWVKEQWLGLGHSRSDLLEAPRLLLAGQALLGKQAVVLHYEEMVQSPEPAMCSLCEHLGVPFEPAMVDYGAAGLPRWEHADQTGLYSHSRPDASHAERWRAGLADPQVWRIMADYLAALGPAVVHGMGSDYAALAASLAERRPGSLARRATFSLSWLSRQPPAERPWWDRRAVWLERRLRKSFALR